MTDTADFRDLSGAGIAHLFHVQAAVVVGVVHGAVFPVALGVSESPVHSTHVQQVAANRPHDAGFAADPDSAATLRQCELPHCLLQPPPNWSSAPAAVQPSHLKPAGDSSISSSAASVTSTKTWAKQNAGCPNNQTITVLVNGDTVVEANETFLVNLTNATNGYIGDNQGVGAIANDDTAPPLEVFFDSFEVAEWNGLWTEDSQNDWFCSNQRATNGGWSAEVDGSASNAQLISVPINLQGRTNATITFSWLIESSLDSGEYIAFDVSTNGGSSSVEKARLRGNVSQENTWHNVTVTVNAINNLRLRFRGNMNQSDEDANVDNVKVVAF